MKVRKISIFTQLFSLLAVLIFAGLAALCTLASSKAKDALFRQIQSNASNIASAGAAHVNGEALRRVSDNPEDVQSYETVLSQLALFRDNAELEYIYTIERKSMDEIVFLVDSDIEEPADVGDLCDITEAMHLAYDTKTVAVDNDTVEDEWGTHLSAYAPVFCEDTVVGLVGVDVDATWIARQVANIRNTIVLIALCTYVISLLGLHLVVRKFKKNMVTLNNKVKELASGSGDLTKTVDITTGDELEVSAGNMNSFIHHVRSLVQSVCTSTKSLHSAGEALDGVVNDNVRVIRDMSTKIEDITASMEESSASSQLINETLLRCSENLEVFAAQLSAVSENAVGANNKASMTLENTRDNRQNALKMIRELNGRMLEVSEDMKKIEQVQEIAKEVRTIAGKTNMLSLNASIEAARAGEAGKGFAVVASQVGELSASINSAVSQINQINEQVLKTTDVMMKTIDDMVRFVTEDVVRDYDIFEKVTEEYGQVTERIQSAITDIHAESDALFGQIRSISEQTQVITEMVGSTSENATNLALSTGKISESMEELSGASKRNVEHAEELSLQVSKYHA